MKLVRACIENVGLISKLDIPCNGGIVVVTGKNGSGKTTVLRAIKSVFEGGHQPDLIGPHAPQAVVELEFDNGARYRREWSKAKFTLKGWSRDGGRIDSPAKTLQALFDSEFSWNPTGLIDAKPSERVEFLHKAMPLVFTRGEVAEATGDPAAYFDETMDVDRLSKIRDGRYDKRREANVEWDRLKKTRETMVSTLPDGDPLRFTWMDTAPGIDGQAKPVPEPVNPLDEVRRLEKGLQEARETLQRALDEWRGSYDQIVGGINAEEQAELEAVRKKYDDKRASAQRSYEQLIAVERKPFDGYIERAAGDLAAAQERAQQQAKLEGVRESIRQLDEQITKAQAEAVRLDNAVKNLDELKRKKLETLPIPGVEVRDGRIYVDGLDFETQVNTARQYLLSTQIAALTLGEDFQFLVVDNTEAMDETNRRLYIEGLRESGFQAVLAAVDDEKPLTVEVVG